MCLVVNKINRIKHKRKRGIKGQWPAITSFIIGKIHECLLNKLIAIQFIFQLLEYKVKIRI